MKKLLIYCIVFILLLLPLGVYASDSEKEEIKLKIQEVNNELQELDKQINTGSSNNFSIVTESVMSYTSDTLNNIISIEKGKKIKELQELKNKLSEIELKEINDNIKKLKEVKNKENNIISSNAITWIGDSYTLMAKNKILTELPECDIYAKGSKHFQMDANNNPSGISILKEIISNNNLRPYLVFALSTNDPVSSESTFNKYIDQVVQLAGTSTTIIFVTPYTRDHVNGKINYKTQINTLKQAESTYSNVRCAKWDEICKNKIDEYFSSDSIHPNNTGMDAWVKCIIDQLYEKQEESQTNIPTENKSTNYHPIDYTWNGKVLNNRNGTVMGPSGKETYYNMDMSNIVSCLEKRSGWVWNDIKKHGNTGNVRGKYWIREDGCKMFGDYIMVAAKLSVHPRGSLVETSLGTGIVVDTGGFANTSKGDRWIDIATNW